MIEEQNLDNQQKPQLNIGAVMRSASEIEERLRCAIAGMNHAKECRLTEIAKDYEKDANVLMWVLNR